MYIPLFRPLSSPNLGNKNEAVAHVDGAVGDGGQLLVVGDDDEGLAELIAQVEEELVELLLVLRVERT